MTVLITFGDARYEQALLRIESEAKASGFFDRVAVKRPADLDRAFWEKHGAFVEANRRGYAYWLWKPWLIRAELQACSLGELLVYTDAGCTIDAGGGQRLLEYRELVERSEAGVLGFVLAQPEKAFTKGDAFEALGAWPLKDTPQVMATIILLRQCAAAMRFVEDWLRLGESYGLISDSPSVVPNDPAFVEHRHDQSLFSLLAKLRGAALIEDETCRDDGSVRVPFRSSRLKSRQAGPFRGLRRDIGVRWQRARQLLPR